MKNITDEQYNFLVNLHIKLPIVNGVTYNAIEDSQKIQFATHLISEYGYIDRAHHKQWLIDQIARVLIDEYDEWAGDDWDTGIAP